MAWTTPRTWNSGELVTASMMNLHVRDNLNYLFDAIGLVAAAFTPTWSASGTAVSLGNGSQNGFYQQLGKRVWFRWQQFWGTTTTNGTGYWQWALPVTPAAGIFSGYTLPIGIVHHVESGVAWHNSIAVLVDNSHMRIFIEGDAGTGLPSGAGFTFGNLDAISVCGTYEAQ